MGADSSIRGTMYICKGATPVPTFGQRLAHARARLRPCWDCGRSAFPFGWGLVCYSLGIAIGAWLW